MPRSTAQSYLTELISYGGEMWPRGRVIADLQRLGRSQAQIDAYMIGLERGAAARTGIARAATTEIQALTEDDARRILLFTFNGMSLAAEQAALTLEQYITTLAANGMPREQIRALLLSDLSEGGPIFASVKNTFRRAVASNIEDVSNGTLGGMFDKNLTDTQVYDWVLDERITNHCEDCLDRAGREPMTWVEWELIGLPKAGATVCNQNCGCKLEPAE
jgi:hypothetical protein